MLELTQAAEAARRLARRKSRNRLADYRPYDKQMAFHAAGKDHRERLFLAGNQLGKSYAACGELAMHLTGDYPDWWPGRRFTKPIHAWAAGLTGETTRDNPQRLLFGPPAARDQWGTGTIPGDCIMATSLSRGVPDALDQAVIKHKAGQSILGFKSYERERTKWQGPTLDCVLFDEEPPADIYAEGLARIAATGGMTWIAATPLLGMSDVVRLFYPQPAEPTRHVTRMELSEAEHIPESERAAIEAGFPEHEREARTRGIPMLGSGRVFPVAEAAITCEPFQIPDWFAEIGGLDFGIAHPFGAVRLSWDRDDDVLYVTACYRAKDQTPAHHAIGVKPWGNLPFAWPHDGLQRDKGSGAGLAAQYRTYGLDMLPDHATHEAGGFGTEAGVMLLLEYMLAGRFKVFAHLEQWFEEFRHYHRKDGVIVKEHDDLMSATRVAAMMLRHARVTKPARARNRSLPRGYKTDYTIFH